jgi:hypothetical protein
LAADVKAFTEIDGVRVYVPKAYFTTAYLGRKTRAVEETVRALIKRYPKANICDVTIYRVVLKPDRMTRYRVDYSWSSEVR